MINNLNANTKKVVVYIDAANIILSGREIGFEIDFQKLKIYLYDVYRADIIYFFTANLQSQKDFYKELEDIGFKIILKQVYFENSKTKANCDVEISHYITRDVENKNVDTIVLLSGDGDFSMLLDYGISNKVETFLMPTNKKSCSKMLRKKKGISITFLEDIRSKIEKTPAST